MVVGAMCPGALAVPGHCPTTAAEKAVSSGVVVEGIEETKPRSDSLCPPPRFQDSESLDAIAVRFLVTGHAGYSQLV